MRRWGLWVCLALLGCGDDGDGEEPEEEEGPPTPAQLVVSTTEVDLGQVVPGEIATAVLTVSNQGGVPLGISRMALGGGHPGFSARWDPADIAPLRREPPRQDSADTGAPPDIPAGDFTLILGPRTSLEVELAFTPDKPGESWNALVIETKREPRSDLEGIPLHERIYADRDNRWVVVYLHGESTEPQTEVEPLVLVGGRMALDHTAVESGGELRARALVVGGTGERVYTWAATGGTLEISVGPSITWSAPTVEQRRSEALRVTVDGALWTTARVDVWRTGELSEPIQGR